jgi:hypothetical protein
MALTAAPWRPRTAHRTEPLLSYPRRSQALRIAREESPTERQTMGDIGENQREIEIEPVDIPAQPPIEAPVEQPAEPEPVPA